MRWLAMCLFLAACADAAPGPRAPHTPARRVVPGDVVIRDVRVFDGDGVVEQATVIVAGEEIAAVGPGLVGPPDAEVVDGRGKTLLPGLIDAHVHLWNAGQLEQALHLGVTTELDMMTGPALVDQLRSQLADGALMADFRSAGNPVTVPGGHGTQYGLSLDALEDDDSPEAFVDDRVEEGSDYIKVILEHGFGEQALPTLDPEQLAMAVRAGHARDKLVVAHVGSATEARDAVAAGVDGLVHLYQPGGEVDVARRIAAEDVFVVPTLSVLFSICDGTRGAAVADDERIGPYLFPAAVSNLRNRFEIEVEMSCEALLEEVGKLRGLGVRILAGTDAPNPGTAHGASLHDELVLLVEAGMRPAEAPRAATSETADAFDLENRGRVAAGKRADLVLVEGDPTEDVTATRRIVAVWKAGTRVDRATDRTARQQQREPRGEASDDLEAGLVSTFDGDEIDAQIGAGWSVSTDAMMGGSSKATMALAEGGADDTSGALAITGEVADRQGPQWAGVALAPGPDLRTPVDLSSTSELAFWARGDAGTYVVMMFTPSMMGTPPTREFTLEEGWKRIAIPLADFGADTGEVLGFFIGSMQEGSFEIRIDEVRLAE